MPPDNRDTLVSCSVDAFDGSDHSDAVMSDMLLLSTPQIMLFLVQDPYDRYMPRAVCAPVCSRVQHHIPAFDD